MCKLDPIDDGSCKGCVIKQGENKGKWSRSSRPAVAACEAAHGPRPEGYVVRHLCPNDSNVNRRGEGAFICINPAHIEWNTYKQNGLDAAHNISAAKKGKPMSEEQKQKISAAKKGKKGKTGMPSLKKGKPMSEEQKQKISVSMKGKKRGHSPRKGKKYGPYKKKTV